MVRPEFAPAEAYRLERSPSPRPIVVLGPGGIGRAADLPAFQKAGFRLAASAAGYLHRAHPPAADAAAPRPDAAIPVFAA